MIIVRQIGLVLLLLFVPEGVPAAEVRIVADPSMSPGLSPNDRILLETVPLASISKHDIVAIQLEADQDPVVTRVVAVPGDRISVQNRTLMVNGTAIRKLDFQVWKSTLGQLEHFRWVVPGDNLLVLGDNSSSRQPAAGLNLVSMAQLAGKVVRVTRSGSPKSPK